MKASDDQVPAPAACIIGRAPRIAPHRQPVARPFRPPGRPGFLALLPVARRPCCDLRRRAPAALIMVRLGRCRRARRSSIRMVTRSPGIGAAQGRSPQLRHPQSSCSNTTTSPTTSARDLPAAQRTAGNRRFSGNHHRDAHAVIADRFAPTLPDSVEEQWEVAADWNGRSSPTYAAAPVGEWPTWFQNEPTTVR